MISDTIDSNATPESETPKVRRKSTKKSKPAKQATSVKKPHTKRTAERTNKKAELIALMKHTKGATLTEIVNATGWQAHTVRGFISILRSKGGQKLESSKNADGERTYKISK